jgi:hypothetical protein
LFRSIKFRIQKIGKEKKLYNDKKDEELDQNNNPKLLSHRHTFESFEIKIKYIP